MTVIHGAGPVEASVVVPSYNDRGSLRGCLEALEAQTARDRLQVVVSVDGGEPLSDDLSAMADFVVEGPHSGPAAARNRGWRLSAGRYILFTDSDCRPAPSWAEVMLDGLRAGADGVKGSYSGGGGSMVQRLAQVEFEERYRLLGRRDSIDLVDTYSAGFTRISLEAAGGFDEGFPFPDHEDVDLSYRMVRLGMNLRFLPDALVEHTHRRNWVGYFRMKHSRGMWRMKVLTRFPDKRGGGCYTPRCLKVQIGLAALLLPVAAVTPFFPVAGAAWLAAFLLSSIPLGKVALERDPGLVPLIPIFAFWRACALFSGMVRGIFTAGRGEGT